MSDRLDKAQRAFADAVEADHESAGVPELERKVFKLLDISRTQAAIAGAEALEELVRWCKLTATGQDDERKQTGYIARSAERDGRTWYGD